MSSTGTLNAFVLPVLRVGSARNDSAGTMHASRGFQSHRRKRQQKQKELERRRWRQRRGKSHHSKSAARLHVREPTKITEHKVMDHLKTINRCQPASWLSPYAGALTPDREDSLHAQFNLPELDKREEDEEEEE
jgi:hypothetical protein